MKKNILFYGDLGIDIIIETDSFPQLGQDSIIYHTNTLPGGSSANSAVVASHLNLESYYMGLVGNDFYHDLLKEDLIQNNVKIDYLKEVVGKNTLIIAIVSKNGERTFFSYRGVNGSLKYGEIPQKFTTRFDCIHISGYCFQDRFPEETAMNLIADGKTSKTILSLDPSYIFSNSAYGNNVEFISNFDIVIPNKEEALLMTDQKDVRRASNIIRGMGPKFVIIKMAEEGCLLNYQDQLMHIPAYPLKQVRNTIGAGDAFCSGFLAGILNGLSPEISAKMGNAAAHMVLLGEGGHSNFPSLKIFKDFFQSKNGFELHL